MKLLVFISLFCYVFVATIEQISSWTNQKCYSYNEHLEWKTVKHVEKVYGFLSGTNFIIRYSDGHSEEIDSYQYNGEQIGDKRYVKWQTTYECGCKAVFAFWIKPPKNPCP